MANRIWVQIRPTRLPSSQSTLIVGTLYHPPKANGKDLQQKVVNYSTLSLLSNWNNSLWGFNYLLIKMVKNCHPDMKQVVKERTCGDSILDLLEFGLRLLELVTAITSCPSNCPQYGPVTTNV